MTIKFDNFKDALIHLCNEHKVALDLGRDGMDVYDNPFRKDWGTDPEVLYGSIDDCTFKGAPNDE